MVGLHQRGRGRSRPLVIDALGRIGRHTTQRLIVDIEALREHIGINRWLASGASWGTTLALACAQAHPESVRDIVLLAVTTTSREEVDRITEGVGRLSPEAWGRIAAASGRRPGERIVEAEGHGGPAMTERARRALEAFAARRRAVTRSSHSLREKLGPLPRTRRRDPGRLSRDGCGRAHPLPHRRHARGRPGAVNT